MKSLEQINRDLTALMVNNYIFSNKLRFLYHYTDLDSAKSIIENEQFWVSDAFSTNDEKEIIHIRETIDAIVNEEYQDMEPWRKDFCKSAFDIACDLLKLNTFMLCFSLIKDSKSLWENYANKDSKIGVCMRFDFEKIAPNPVSELLAQKRYFLDQRGNAVEVELRVLDHSVTYSKQEIQIRIDEYLGLVAAVLNRMSLKDFNDPDYEDERELLVNIFTDILLYSSLSKESSWSDEKEFRMVFIFPDIIKYDSLIKVRKRGAQEVRYLSLNMKANSTFSLSRIYVSSENDLISVKLSLKNFENKGTRIKVI